MRRQDIWFMVVVSSLACVFGFAVGYLLGCDVSAFPQYEAATPVGGERSREAQPPLHPAPLQSHSQPPPLIVPPNPTLREVWRHSLSGLHESVPIPFPRRSIIVWQFDDDVAVPDTHDRSAFDEKWDEAVASGDLEKMQAWRDEAVERLKQAKAELAKAREEYDREWVLIHVLDESGNQVHFCGGRDNNYSWVNVEPGWYHLSIGSVGRVTVRVFTLESGQN